MFDQCLLDRVNGV